MEVVMQIFQSLGFPVACVVCLAYYIHIQNKQYRDDVKNLTDKYERAIDKFSRAIDKNTQVLTVLEERISGKGNKE